MKQHRVKSSDSEWIQRKMGWWIAAARRIGVLGVLGGVLWATGPARAQSFSDNFNRANSTNIGTGWADLRNTNWAILNNTVVMQTYEAANAPAILAYTGLTLSAQYTLSLDVKLDAAGVLVGPAFNIQNATNYYTVRFQENASLSGTGFYQFLKYVNGAPTVLGSSNGFLGISAGTWYTIAVTNNASSFSFSIVNSATTNTLLTGSAVDASSPFTQGYGGMYSASIGGNYDNFSIVNVPEPSALALAMMAAGGIWLLRSRVRPFHE